MADYPNTLPVFTEDFADASDQQTVHAAHHNQLADELGACLAILGTNPEGSYASVKERLEAALDISTLLADESDARVAADTDLQSQVDVIAAAGATVGFVVHGATAGTARPTGYDVIFWHGSVEPTNGTSGDVWFAEGAGSSGGGGGDLATHIAGTANVHGITNSSQLVYTNDVRLNPILTPNAKTASYTVTTTDMGKTVDVTVTSPTVATITVPAALGADGNVFEICQLGTGGVDIVGTGGVTFRSVGDLVNLDSRGSVVRARRLSSTLWHLAGDLAA